MIVPAKHFELDLVTADRSVFSGRVTSLKAPGTEGAFGVLADHAPMVAALTAGVVEFTDIEGKRHYVAISGGFFEIFRNCAIILADTAEPAQDIDEQRARAALQRAQRRLRRESGEDVDRQRASAAAARASARLKAVELSKRQ